MVQITERAMLVNLNISTWTARKHDKGISQEVASSHGTASDVGRYNKTLIAKEALEKIGQAQSAARTFHYENTLPWMDNGARILAAANYLPYTEKMRSLRATYDAEVAAFLANYDGFVADARRRLNGMFKDADYPNARQIARKFDFDVAVLPLPTAADFRVDISDKEHARIAADIQRRTDAAIAGAVSSTWERVHEVVAKMADRLRQYAIMPDGKVEAPFRDTLVQNVRDLVELLPRLNITADPALDAMAQRLTDTLCAHDPQTLRDDGKVRNETAQQAEQILADMAGFCGFEVKLAA